MATRSRRARAFSFRPDDVEVNTYICPLTPYTPYSYGNGTLSYSGQIGQCYDDGFVPTAMAELELQVCLYNLVTGGWVLVSCVPANDKVYIAYSAMTLTSPSIYANCVRKRYYMTWVYGYAESPQGSIGENTANTKNNGTKC